MELVAIMNILAGLILCIGILGAIPIMGKYLLKIAKWLGGFQTIIGIITIIIAILFNAPILQRIVAIIAGFILIVGILPEIPAVGKELEQLSKQLGSFQTIIGIITIILGIWGLF